MSDPEHADQILTAAARDLRALRAMVDSPEFSEEIFGFHAQQVCEKVLKAWLTLLGKRYPKTHDLKMLIDLLAAEGIDVEGLAQFVDLNAYAVQYRYESLYEDEEPLDRAALAGSVEVLLKRVRNELRPSSTDPPEGGS